MTTKVSLSSIGRSGIPAVYGQADYSDEISLGSSISSPSFRADSCNQVWSITPDADCYMVMTTAQTGDPSQTPRSFLLAGIPYPFCVKNPGEKPFFIKA